VSTEFYCQWCPLPNVHLHHDPSDRVVMVDVHSTLALVHPRQHLAPRENFHVEALWVQWHQSSYLDVPHQGLVALLDLVSESAQIVVVSYGVTSRYLSDLVAWLKGNEVPFDAVRVHPHVEQRPVDVREDQVLWKISVVQEVERAGGRVKLFVDDNPWVCEGLEESDVTVLSVNPRYSAPVPALS
jgi:hypothetical protein